MKRTDTRNEDRQLSLILHQHFGLNLARCGLMANFVMCLCKLRTVNFERLASGFSTPAKASSSLRRIQRFMAGCRLDPGMVARLVFRLLPCKQDLRLVLDRTNWRFGGTDINILMLGVAHQGAAFPLLFALLPKRGNSDTAERIALVERFIALFGRDCIGCLVADREFVGSRWVGYLNAQCIPYHIRIRENFKVLLPRKQQTVRAFWLFNHLQPRCYHCYPRIVSINGEHGYLSGCRLGKGEFLIVFSFNRPQDAQENYAQRWQIEMCFKAMKSGGFDIGQTHLRDPERLEKLVLLVAIAFAWCYAVGEHLHRNVAPVKVKKHGRMAKSIFRYGLEHIAKTLLNPNLHDVSSVLRFLSCT